MFHKCSQVFDTSRASDDGCLWGQQCTNSYSVPPWAGIAQGSSSRLCWKFVHYCKMVLLYYVTDSSYSSQSLNRLCHTGLRHSKSWFFKKVDYFKSYAHFARYCVCCLNVAFHQKGSAINRATLSRFDLPRQCLIFLDTPYFSLSH